MKALLVTVALGIGALISHGAYAEAPAGSTALCKDGSYFSGKTKRGACKGHQGIQEWYGAAGPTAAAATAAADETATKTKKHKKKAEAEAEATPAVAAAPAPAAPAATKEKRAAPTPAKDIVQKPGGGPGLVWVNSGTKVYHCQGDEWYGKTKEGSYMAEAAAIKTGAHGSAGKTCANR